MPIRVLFVDDDRALLDGLRRQLHSARSEWEMHFVVGAAGALELMARQPFEVVVSDYQMPKMGGDEFLAAVRERFPTTARLVLSGRANTDAMLRLLPLAHRFLSKPCTPAQLLDAIAGSYSYRELLPDPSLAALIGQLGSLPTPPALHVEVLRLMSQPGAYLPEVAELLAGDMAVAAKMMQAANTVFYGTEKPVADLRKAMHLLGPEAIVANVLETGLFTRYEPATLAPYSIDGLWAHSREVSLLAGQIAKAEGANYRDQCAAELAGLLHDVGRLVLVTIQSERYRRVLELVEAEGLPLTQAEQRVFGTTHAEVGAYLLGLWGLPVSLVVAVARHHTPSHFPATGFSSLTPVHVAEGLLDGDPTPLDAVHLTALGLADRVAAWGRIRDELWTRSGNPTLDNCP